MVIKESDPARAHELAMTEFEYKGQQYYQTECKAGMLKCHMLNQNPVPPVSRGISSGITIMHTLISNMGLVWVAPQQRFLVPEEMLIMNGIPTRRCLGNVHSDDADCCSSFALDRALKRKRNAMTHQAGNTMNVAVCGAFWIYCLGVVKRMRGSTQADIEAASARRADNFFTTGNSVEEVD